MKRECRFAFVFVTAPNLKTARALARMALEARSVACANIIPKIESHYWWQRKIERAGEVLIIFKTSDRRVSNLQKLILANHPYDTPEFAVVRVDRANERYLQWIASTLR